MAGSSSLLRGAYQGYTRLIPDHYKAAFPLLSLTELRLKTRQFGKAEQTSRTAMVHFSKTLPAGHPLFAVAQSRHGAALTGLGRFDEAEAELTEALSILEGVTGFERYHEEASKWLAELHAARE